MTGYFFKKKPSIFRKSLERRSKRRGSKRRGSKKRGSKRRGSKRRGSKRRGSKKCGFKKCGSKKCGSSNRWSWRKGKSKKRYSKIKRKKSCKQSHKSYYKKIGGGTVLPSNVPDIIDQYFINNVSNWWNYIKENEKSVFKSHIMALIKDEKDISIKNVHNKIKSEVQAAENNISYILKILPIEKSSEKSSKNEFKYRETDQKIDMVYTGNGHKIKLKDIGYIEILCHSR